jgi:hypothetical protein
MYIYGCVYVYKYTLTCLQGSAKTTMINSHMKKYSTETHVLMSSTFSSTTTPQLFQVYNLLGTFQALTPGRLLALPTNIRLGWKGLPGTSTLAYYENP